MMLLIISLKFEIMSFNLKDTEHMPSNDFVTMEWTFSRKYLGTFYGHAPAKSLKCVLNSK